MSGVTKAPSSVSSENEVSPTTDAQESTSSNEVVSNSSESRFRMQWLRKLTRRARQRLHYRLPNLTLLQDLGTRDYVKHRDERKNTETRVTPEDELRLRALWGVEIFGPTEVDGLYVALKRLDWDIDNRRGPDTGALKWISEQRMYGSEGNFNLGVIQRKGQRRNIFSGRHAPIPETVDYMHGYIYQVSPSTTAVILCFVLTEEVSTSYEATLNTDRHTTNQPNRRSGGYHIFDVEHLKRRSVEDIRSKSRRIVTDWFQENLPGFFSLAGDGNRLPTAELITTANEPLLSGTGAVARNEPPWVRLMKSYGLCDVWTLKDFQGFSLAWDESDDASRYHSLINLQTGLLRDERLKHLGDSKTPSFSAFVSERVEGILVHFAVVAFLRDVIRTLRLTRDTMSTNARSHRAVLSTIGHIKSFFDKSIGLPTMTAELAAKSENDHSYRWLCAEFESEPWRPGEPSAKIAETLRDRTHYLAARALAQEKETREHLEQVSTILSIQESIRAQRRMQGLTIAATVVATASLLIALMSVDRFASAINLQVERLLKTK